MTLTKPQRVLLAELNEEPEMWTECAAELEWRTAKSLRAKGLIEVDREPERAAVGYWFDARLTDAGRQALVEARG